MNKKVDILEETPRRGERYPKDRVLRDAAWEAEKKWFEENRSLDSLALFAKYFQRL